MDYDKIGKFILKLRKEKGYSQNDLAAIIPISRQAISKWERGVTIPDSSTLIRLSEIFSVSINDLLKGGLESKESLEDIALKMVDDANEKRKKMRLYVLISSSIIGLLLLLFFFYYFVNSYNNVRVYTFGYDDSIFTVKDSMFISTKQKKYLKLGSVTSNDKTISINKMKLYYKVGKDYYLLLGEDNSDRIAIDYYGYDEIFPDVSFDKFISNVYLEINYNDNKTKILKMKFKRDFVNSNLFFVKKPKSSKEDNSYKYEVTVYEKEFIDKMTEIGTKSEDGYYYKIDDESYIYYNENIKWFYLIRSDKILWYYNFKNNALYCSKIKNKDKCKKYIYDYFMNI